MHAFEKAELGKAPFKVTGMSTEVGPKRWTNSDGVTCSVGAPGQPMGCCDYCGTGIKYVFHIKASDGKTFVVGSECVRKTYDKSMTTEVERMLKKHKKLAEADRIEAAIKLLDESSGLVEYIRGKDSPSGYGNGIDYCNFMVKNAGHTGRLKMARYIERMAKEMEG